MSRTSQRDKLRLLFEANIGKPIPLPEILSLRISQYGTRILELRRQGYDIRNETVDVVDGQKHTTFTYYGRKTAPIVTRDTAETVERVERDDYYESRDWFERQVGRPRPSQPSPDLGPLFRQDGAA
jgi:hypothetical protein